MLLMYALFVHVVNNYAEAGRPNTYKCPEDIFIGWRETPPYVIKNTTTNKVTGFLIDIFEGSFRTCCANNITLHYEDEVNEQSLLVDLTLNSSVDAIIPIGVSLGKDKFLTFPFVGLVESPGSVLYNFEHHKADEAIKNTLSFCFPVVCLIFMSVCVVGVLFWIMEILPGKHGSDRSIRMMISEIGEGVWWAFVTLSTVGYGDVLPSRICSRVICFAWLVFSSVTIAVYTATVTSMLIKECFTGNLEVSGSKIAIINGSNEHKMVLKKSGYPAAYPNMRYFIEALTQRTHAQGGLIEIYAASYYQPHLKEYRIQNIFEEVKSYGVVLRTRIVKLDRCFHQYVLDQQRIIYENIRKSFPPLKTHYTKSSTEEKSASLLIPTTNTLITTLVAVSSTIVLLCLIGILREKFFLSKQHKNDDEEDFTLLHTIKENYHEKIRATMLSLQKEISALQKEIHNMSDRLNSPVSISNSYFGWNEVSET